MNVELGFLDPYTLHYLSALIPITLFSWWAYRNRTRVARKLLFTGRAHENEEGSIRRGSSLRATALLFIPFAILAFALGRPFVGHERVEIPVPGIDYIFVVDISQSMLARDISPSRIAVAKRKMLDTIEEFKRRGGGSRFGITLFAGSAYLFCPLTGDYTVLKQFIESISPGLVTTRGSNIAAGIEVALERLKGVRSKSGRLLLLSDGEDLNPTHESLISTLKAEHVPVDSIGLGSTEGSPIEVRTGFFLKDSRGETIISRLQEDLPKRLAQESGGLYVRATVGDSDIRTVAESALKRFSSGNSVVAHIDQYNEIGPWLALLGGVLVVIISSIRSCGLSIMLLLTLFFSASLSSSTAFCQESALSSPAEANPFELFQSGKYPEAISAYRERLKERPSDVTLKKGLAASHYYNGDFTEAAKIYGEIADTTTKGHEFFENKYNQGNALLKEGKLSEAVSAYEKALKSKPDDQKALHNKDVARALIEEKKRENEKQKKEKSERQKQEEQKQEAEKQEKLKEDALKEQQDGQQRGQQQDNEQKLERDKEGDSQSSDKSASSNDDDTFSHAPPTPIQREGEAAEEKSPLPPPSDPSSSPTSPPQESKNEGEAADKSSSEQSEEGEPPSRDKEGNSAQLDARPDQENNGEKDGEKDGEREGETAGSPSETPDQSPENRNAEKSLAPSEAEMWIESLPDAPLLLRRHGGPPPASGQTW